MTKPNRLSAIVASVFMCFMCLMLGGCGGGASVSSDLPSTASSASASWSSSSASESPNPQADRYAAYLAKVEEYQSKYGIGEVESVTQSKLDQMQGLCLADLIDFDGDGNDELLLGYYDELQEQHATTDGFADAQAYRAEVWGFDGESAANLFISNLHWTNGGFAYLPLYYRSDDVVLRTIEYSSDGEGRSTSEYATWALQGDSFEEISTSSFHGMYGTGTPEYIVDGEVVDQETFETRSEEVLGDDCDKTVYWMTWSDSSSTGAANADWDVIHNPEDTLGITGETIAKLGGETPDFAGPSTTTSDSSASSSQPSDAFAGFPQSFVFTSGAGAWSTDLDVAADGTFTGSYHDSDMGDTGEGYPNGTRREVRFEGAFTTPEKVDDFEYRMQLASLAVTDEPGEFVEGGVRVIREAGPVYGLGDECDEPTGDYRLHLPGQDLSAFSQNAAIWLFIQNASGPSDFYAIVNASDPEQETAFRTYDSEAASSSASNEAESAESGGAPTESDLREQIEAKADHEILHWFYQDFDKDGSKEAIAITGVESADYEGEWTDGKVWFADAGGVASPMVTGNVLNGIVVDSESGCGFLSIENDGHGSGSTSYVYVVKDGKCWMTRFDIGDVGNFHNDGERMIGFISKYGNGHQYEWHEFAFNDDDATFTSEGAFDTTTSRVYDSSGGHPSSSASSTSGKVENVYASYLQKIEEYHAEYGEADLAVFSDRADSDDPVRYAVGLCFVRLLDFDKDGIDEMLLVYRDKGDVAAGNAAFEPSDYHVEVWAQVGGALERVYDGTLLHQGVAATDGMWLRLQESSAESDPVVIVEQRIPPPSTESETWVYEFDGETFDVVDTIESNMDEASINGEVVSEEDRMPGGSVDKAKRLLSPYKTTMYLFNTYEMEPTFGDYQGEFHDCSDVEETTADAIAAIKSKAADAES